MLPTKAKKKKRGEDHLHLKRVKLENAPAQHGKTHQFETTLSPPIQEALSKFREASEQELIRLRKEGMDSSAAINKLVEKMRSSEELDVTPSFTRQELELVMEIAGVNEEGATRALILRSELAKLRHDGFNHPEAINELSRRMKRLAGSKRRGTSAVERREAHKHRRRGSTIPTSPTLSFTALLDPLSSNTTTTTTTTTTTSTTTPEQSASTRKRWQDTLMMDEEQFGLLRKKPKYDLSDSESSDDDIADKYHFEVSGEFSQDEKDGEDEEGEGRREDGGDSEDVKSPEDIIPLAAPFDYSISSSDEDGFHILRRYRNNNNNNKDSTSNELDGGEGMDDVDISGWSESILFNPVTTTDEEEGGGGEDHDEEDEGEDSETDVWLPASAHNNSNNNTTTTTTTTTTTSTNSTDSDYLSLPPLFPPSTLTTPTSAPHSVLRTPRVPQSTKRRDGTSAPHSSRVLSSQRSIS